MKLLLDEVYPASLAEALRALGHDVVSIHEPDVRDLEGATDDVVFDAARSQGRALVTEDVPHYRALEDDALAHSRECPIIVYTTNRAFPRGRSATVGRLVRALDALLTGLEPTASTFLRPAD